MDLLRVQANITAFYISFANSLYSAGTSFENIDLTYRNINLLQAKLVVIPFLLSNEKESYECLIIWNEDQLNLFSHEKKPSEFPKDICKLIDKAFIRKLYQSFSQTPPNVEYKIIPATQTILKEDIWIYFLAIAKNYVFDINESIATIDLSSSKK